jgi:hypothetical protein
MAKIRDRAKEKYWRRLHRQQRASGESAGRFCKRQRIPVHQFYWWQRTLRERDRQRETNKEAKHQQTEIDQAFMPVRLPLFAAGPIEVVHPKGWVVRLADGFNPLALERVLDALEARASRVAEG